jgi:polar amino acid transport system substrate-binding protein
MFLQCLSRGLACLALWLTGSLAVAAQTPPLLIGAEDDWAPFSSVENGKPVGMAVDIVRAIFAEAGLAIQLVPMPYDRCMQQTLSGRLQGCFDTAQDARMRRDYLFHSQPLFSDTALILVRADSHETRLQARDLEGRNVIVTSGYTYGDAFEGNPKIERVAAIGDINTLRMLKAATADQAIVYRRILAYLLKGKGQDLQGAFKTAGTLSVNKLYLSFSTRMPDAKEVLKKFNAAHLRLVKSHAIADIEKRWE